MKDLQIAFDESLSVSERMEAINRALAGYAGASHGTNLELHRFMCERLESLREHLDRRRERRRNG